MHGCDWLLHSIMWENAVRRIAQLTAGLLVAVDCWVLSKDALCSVQAMRIARQLQRLAGVEKSWIKDSCCGCVCGGACRALVWCVMCSA